MNHIRCPHCKSMLSIPDEYRKDKQLQCSHCGEIFNNYMIKKKKQQLKVDKFLITLAIFLTLWGVKACIESQPRSSKNSVENQYESSISIGDNVEVIKTTIGLIDEASVDEFGKAAVAGDAIGVDQLIITGKGRQIPAGEQGKVIERTVSADRIRLNDGTAWWILISADLKKVNE